MKTTIKRYGLRAALVMVIFSAISFILISGDNSKYDLGEIIGYLSMFLAMIFVYLGIRNYRDHQNNGELSFGQALKLGLLIALFPAIAFGIMDQIYVQVINPNFYEEYYQTQLDNIDDSNAEEYQKQLAKLQSQQEMFSIPIVSYLLMFVTVFLIGIVVTIISGLILKSPPAVSN